MNSAIKSGCLNATHVRSDCQRQSPFYRFVSAADTAKGKGSSESETTYYVLNGTLNTNKLI